jgi:hypothetical protein
MKTPEGVATFEAIAREVADLVLEYGGLILAKGYRDSPLRPNNQVHGQFAGCRVLLQPLRLALHLRTMLNLHWFDHRYLLHLFDSRWN